MMAISKGILTPSRRWRLLVTFCLIFANTASAHHDMLYGKIGLERLVLVIARRTAPIPLDFGIGPPEGQKSRRQGKEPGQKECR
jgi:hypothetical protein